MPEIMGKDGNGGKLPFEMRQSRTALRHSFGSTQTQQSISVVKVVLVLTCIIGSSCGLDCYKCVSIGGDNPSCEEPFHTNYSEHILESPCMGGRKGRNGVFPATSCIKMAGVYEDTGVTMVVRGCGLDSGTLTVDTEIVRMSHCGGFVFDGRYVNGCLQSCSIDGCNAATSIIASSFLPILLFVVIRQLHGRFDEA